MSIDRPEHPGDPRHEHHETWLLELGRATYAAARLAGIMFDLLRVHCGFSATTLYNDTHGDLLARLRHRKPDLGGIDDFLRLATEAVAARNDLMHALPVLHGLHRRKSDLSYVRDYFDPNALRETTTLLEKAARRGNAILYADGGAAVQKWQAAGDGS